MDGEAVEVVVSNPAATDGVDAEAAIARQKEANRKALAALLDEPQNSNTEEEKKFSEVSLGNNTAGQKRKTATAEKRFSTASQAPKYEDHDKRFSVPFIQGANHDQLYLEADAVRANSDAGNIELVEWIPNLPQLFLYLLMTQVVIVFVWFIAYCAEPKDKPSYGAQSTQAFQVSTWVLFLLLSLVFAIYMWFVKKSILKTTVSVLFAMFIFLALFHAPLSTSDSAKAFSATFAFFRVLVILLIGFLYTVAYREDIIPPRAHLPTRIRNFVVTHRLDQA